jgi:O-antigen/teichoic acid export membrane protein
MALLRQLFRALVKWTLGLTLPLAAVMTVFAHPIMVVFGPDFAAGWPVLIVGTFGQLVNCGVGSVGYLLLMSGHQQKLLRIQSIMALILVATNLVLIPRIGLLGAAFAGAGVTAVSNIWYLVQVRRSLGIWPSLSKYRALIVPAATMLAAVLLFRHYAATVWPTWLTIGAALAVSYVTFIGASLLALDTDDRMVAQALWSKVIGMSSGAKGPAR